MIAGMYALEPTKVVRARLQHLNVRDFPPGLRVGKAKRAEYGVAELYAYAVWFALTEAFVPGAVAAEIVRDAWPELVRVLLASAKPTSAANPSDSSFVAIIPEALAAAGPGTNAADTGSNTWDLRIVGERDLLPSISGAVGGAWFLDIAGLYARMVHWLSVGIAPMGTDVVRAEIDELLLRDGWVAKPEKLGNPEAPPSIRQAQVRHRGDRLIEADYYFTRAIAILESLNSRGAEVALDVRSLRYLRYIEDPAPRERWKAWPRVTDGGVPFWWALAALVQNGNTNVLSHLPATLLAAATNALQDFGDTTAQISLLRSAAERYREMELDDD